ncbi:MAG: hypothetical protein Q8T08_06505 [Ignavibacteria bacterium]|nr:hypothetical protein [Ignavibacteria bacterium]
MKKMKKSYLIFFLFGCLFTYGQSSPIQGSFKTKADYIGNTYIYFEGVNNSDYDFSNLTIACINEVKNEKINFSLDKLDSGDSFLIGAKDGWFWERGEKLYVIFANGKSIYWVYNPHPNGYDQNAITTNNFSNNSNNKYRAEQIKIQIRQLEGKIKDSNRSLQLYEEMGSKNISISNQMLQQSTRQLIRTYENQKSNLEMELIRLQ